MKYNPRRACAARVVLCVCVCPRPSSATGATQRQVGILAVSVSSSLVFKRKKNVSVECAVSAFYSEVKLGPDYVCTCCHRMMYQKSDQKVFSSDLSYI